MTTPYQQLKWAKNDQLLFSADSPELVESGIVKSLHPLQAPLWIDGENVIFVDQSVRKAPGYAQICPPANIYPVRAVHDVLDTESSANGSATGLNIPHIFYGDMTSLYDIAGERTNLVPHSQVYSTYWQLNNISITSSNNTAYDGSPSATLFTAIAPGPAQLFSPFPTLAIPITAGATYTLAFDIKHSSGGTTYNIGFGSSDDSQAVDVEFDTLNGIVTQQNVTGASQIVGQTVVNINNGWWRVSVSGILGGGQSNALVLLQATLDTVAGQAFYVNNVQLELGSIPTAPIPTGTLAVTTADSTLINATVVVAGTGYTSDQWSLESWGNFALASNGSDDIQVNKYDGSGFVKLLGSPPRAQIILRTSPFLLAINTSQNSSGTYNINGDNTIIGPSWFSFCDIDNIEQWLANASSSSGSGSVIQSQAGAQNIRDLDSGIVAAARLGGPIAVYSKETMAVINYIGTPFWFGYAVVLSGFSPVGKFAVVAWNKQNVGFGRDGIWLTDGNTVTYIDPPDIRKYLQDNVNWAYAGKINGFLNYRQSMIEFSFPSLASTEPDTTVCWNFKNNKFSFKPYGRTAGMAKNVFDYPVTLSSTGNIYWNEFGYDADGQAMSSFVQSKPLHCDQRMYWKAVTSVIMNMKQLVGTGVEVSLGVQELLTDPVIWLTPQNLDISSKPLYWQGGDGVFLSLKISSSTLGSDWALAGFDIFGTLNGLVE